VTGLEPPPAEGNDGEKEVVHGDSFGVGWCLQVALRKALAGQAYIFAHPGSGFASGLGDPDGADRPSLRVARLRQYCSRSGEIVAVIFGRSAPCRLCIVGFVRFSWDSWRSGRFRRWTTSIGTQIDRILWLLFKHTSQFGAAKEEAHCPLGASLCKLIFLECR